MSKNSSVFLLISIGLLLSLHTLLAKPAKAQFGQLRSYKTTNAKLGTQIQHAISLRQGSTISMCNGRTFDPTAQNATIDDGFTWLYVLNPRSDHTLKLNLFVSIVCRNDKTPDQFDIIARKRTLWPCALSTPGSVTTTNDTAKVISSGAIVFSGTGGLDCTGNETVRHLLADLLGASQSKFAAALNDTYEVPYLFAEAIITPDIQNCDEINHIYPLFHNGNIALSMSISPDNETVNVDDWQFHTKFKSPSSPQKPHLRSNTITMQYPTIAFYVHLDSQPNQSYMQYYAVDYVGNHTDFSEVPLQDVQTNTDPQSKAILSISIDKTNAQIGYGENDIGQFNFCGKIRKMSIDPFSWIGAD